MNNPPSPQRCGTFRANRWHLDEDRDTRDQLVAYWQGQSTFVDGLTQETCRDFVRTGYGLATIADFAETTRIQGQDLYPEISERLRQALGLITEVGLNGRTGIAMANTQCLTEQNGPAGTTTCSSPGKPSPTPITRTGAPSWP